MTRPVPASGATVVPFGDGAVLVELGERLDLELNARVHHLAAAVRDDTAPWGAPVPGVASLVVPYDVERIDAAQAVTRLRSVVDAALRRDVVPSVGADEPPFEIAVRYGGADGPDLDAVARATGLDASAVVALHTGTTYTVLLLGFVPGFGYLGPLPDALVVPRRATPRPRVPAGSVAVAARQTAVYPLETPGGWHIIGRTEARLWDLTRDPPAALRPGGRVAFRAVG